MFPLPQRNTLPLPTGLIPDRYSARGVHHLTRFPVRNSPKILFPPRARYPGLSPDTARPLWRGREEALMSGREVGVGRRKPFNQERAVVIPGRNGEFISQNR